MACQDDWVFYGKWRLWKVGRQGLGRGGKGGIEGGRGSARGECRDVIWISMANFLVAIK